MQERIHDALRRNAVDEALALAQEWAAQAPDDASAQRSLSAALARAGDPAARADQRHGGGQAGRSGTDNEHAGGVSRHEFLPAAK